MNQLKSTRVSIVTGGASGIGRATVDALIAAGESVVVVDLPSDALRAVEHLIEQGYQHIAHLQDNMVSHGSQKRLKGYYSALKRHKLTKNSEYVVQLSSISIDESRRVTEDLLKTHPEIDAIFAITDEIAVGALQAAQQAGKKIPEEFGVIGFSNWQISRVVQPSLSTIAQPGTEVGRTAFRLLMHHIENPRYFQDNFPVKILKTKLLVRESTDRKIGLAQK